MARRCNDWIKSYLDFTTNTEAPLPFHFWTAVSTLAGALRRNVYFDQRFFKWYPNFYIIFVGRAGIVTKSTSLGIGMNLLRKLEHIHFGSDSVTWQAMIKDLADSKQLIDYPDGRQEVQCAVTFAISEFGTFFTTQDTKLTDHLVSLWDGQTGKFEKATKAAGVDVVENPWINIIAGTTPSWIQENFPEYMVGGGFMSRCVFVYGEKKRQYIAYPKMESQDEFLEKEKELLDDLFEISELKGEFKLSPDAYAFGKDWYQQNFAAELTDERLEGYIARKQGHVHKLAMILSISQSSDLIITKQHLETALKLMALVEDDLPKIFSFVGANREGNIAQEILRYLHKTPKIKREELYQRFLSRCPAKMLEDAISAVVRTGKVLSVPTSDGFFLVLKSHVTKT